MTNSIGLGINFVNPYEIPFMSANDKILKEFNDKVAKDKAAKLALANAMNPQLITPSIKTFDITESDRLKQSISKKLLGASQFNIPLLNAKTTPGGLL